MTNEKSLVSNKWQTNKALKCNRLVIVMESNLRKRLENADGIIIKASLKELKNAVLKVLWEYEEIDDNASDIKKSADDEVEIGKALIFREKIETCPAEIVAIKLVEEDLWYIISTHDCPPEKCATTREAMKCAESELKRLRKFRTIIEGTKGATVEEVHTWKPDRLADAQRIIQIIDDASRRYTH